MRAFKKGEIATVLTIGALIVLGVTSFISSNFLKKKQTTRSSAAVSCTSCNGQGQCIYHPELDPRSGIAPPGTPQCEDTGCVNDQECQQISCAVNGGDCDATNKCCGGLTCNSSGKCEPFPVDTGKCPVDNKRYFDNEITAKSVCGAAGYNGVPTAGGYISQCWQCNSNPCPGKWDMNYSCNPACCSEDNQCPTGQKCGVPNGFCVSGKSCAATSPTTGAPKYIRMCSGATCAWTFCDGKNVPWELCVSDTNTVRTESPWCSSNDFCKTWVPTPAPGVNSCVASNGKSLSCGPTVTEPECCRQGKAKKVHRDCSQSNTSGCVYWCEDGKGGKTSCDDPAACAFDNKQCNAPNLPTAPPRGYGDCKLADGTPLAKGKSTCVPLLNTLLTCRANNNNPNDITIGNCPAGTTCDVSTRTCKSSVAGPAGPSGPVGTSGPVGSTTTPPTIISNDATAVVSIAGLGINYPVSAPGITFKLPAKELMPICDADQAAIYYNFRNCVYPKDIKIEKGTFPTDANMVITYEKHPRAKQVLCGLQVVHGLLLPQPGFYCVTLHEKE